MDEAVRIYQPSFHLNAGGYIGRHARYEEPEVNEEPVEPVTVVEELKMNYEAEPEPEKRDPWKKQTYWETLCEVFKAHDKKEKAMMNRHPWFNLIYNWIIVIGIVALFASFWWWGVQIRNNRKEQAIRESVYAEVQAQEQAKETARLEALKAEQETEEYIVNQMVPSLSKLYFGAKNFEGKYHYTELDFETYGRGAWNRLLNPKYPNTLDEVVFQKDQFLNCNESNPDVEPYHSMAKRHIEKWRSETVAPVSDDYVYAELTPNGVYLKNDFNADGYAIRWRAS